jgi:4-amino-4-deoxy-L-arabinose transferase-like glycosyltransferase
MVLGALALRLVVVAFAYPDQLNPRRDHWPFGYEVGRIARAIATGRGFSDPLFSETGPTAWMTPVYPGLVAGVFKLFGIYTKTSAVVLLSLNSLFSAMTCLPIFFMARQSFGPRVALWASWIWVVFPYAIYSSAALIWETCLTTLLLSLLFLATLRLERSPGLGPWAGFGLLWGLTALTDPVVLSVFPFLGGWACRGLRRRGRPWGLQAVVATLALMAVVTPWFVRNYRTFHRFIPFRDAFGLVLWVGNNGDTFHWDVDSAHPSTSQAELDEYYRLGELRYMARKRSQALDFISSHPGWFARTTLRRILFTWTGFWSLGRRYLAEEPFDPPNIVLCTALTLLALAGLRYAFRESRAAAMPYAWVLLIFPAVYYITHNEVRYRHRIDPLLIVLATYAVIRLLSKKRVDEPSRPVVSTVTGAGSAG